MSDSRDGHTIVICASRSSRYRIFREISEDLAAGVHVVFDNGSEATEMEPENEYACSPRESFDAIIEHDFISFDVFDTLINRSLLQPQDLFTLVGLRLGLSDQDIEVFAAKRFETAIELVGTGNRGITIVDIS